MDNVARLVECREELRILQKKKADLSWESQDLNKRKEEREYVYDKLRENKSKFESDISQRRQAFSDAINIFKDSKSLESICALIINEMSNHSKEQTYIIDEMLKKARRNIEYQQEQIAEIKKQEDNISFQIKRLSLEIERLESEVIV